MFTSAYGTLSPPFDTSLRGQEEHLYERLAHEGYPTLKEFQIATIAPDIEITT